MEPYVGPRPFERDETDLFFGRLGETRLLVSMVLSSRVVLLYALSGAGKTSLLNAAVVPALERKEYFEVLPPARVRALNVDGQPAAGVNPFVAGVLSHWTSDRPASVTALLGQRPHAIGPDGFPRPRAIIVDQLEEVFTAHPERWRERGELFGQLADALKRDALLRVILAIREDYLAQLEPFRELLPGRLEQRLRLELLGPDAARQAVIGPVRVTDRHFAAGVAERLVRDLRTTAITDDIGRQREFEGQYIEPVQLQLACSALWRDLPPDVREINDEYLRRFGDVDQVLTDFYDEAIATSAQAAGVEERPLRESFTETFITAMHTRGTAYQSGERVGTVPLPAVEVLESRRLIRAEWRANARWFELTHDRLIAPIERSNASALARTVSELARVVRGALCALGGVLIAVVPATSLASVTRGALPLATGVAAAANWAVLSALVLAAAALGWTLASGAPMRRRRVGIACGIGGAVGGAAGAALWSGDGAAGFVLVFALMGAVVGRTGIVAPARRAAALAAAAGGGVAGLALSSAYFGAQVLVTVTAFVPIVVGAWLPEMARAGSRAVAGESFAERWRSRTPKLVAGLATAIVTTVIIAVIALNQARTTERERTTALSRSLAAQSAVVANAEVGALLSVESYRASPTQEAVDAMIAALTRLQPRARADVGQVRSVAVESGGRIFAAAGSSDVVRFFSLSAGLPRATRALREPGLTTVAFAPDGHTVATGSDDGDVGLWDLRNGTRRVVRVSPPVLSVDFAPSGKRLAAGGGRGVSLVDIGDGRVVATLFTRGVTSVRFSPSGSTLAVASNDGSVGLWGVSGGVRQRVVLRGARGGVLSVAFTPDGQMLAAAGVDGAIRLWRMRSARASAVLRGHSGSVFSVDFNQDGRLLASAGDDATVRIWRPTTRARPVILRGLTGSVRSAVFSPDGRTLVTGGSDGMVRLIDRVLWTGNPAELEASICARVDRSLTPAEWDRFLPSQPYQKTCD